VDDADVSEGTWGFVSSERPATAADDDDDGDNSILQLTQTWRQLPALNPTLEFPTWKVPVATLQFLLQSDVAQAYFATRLDLWEHVAAKGRIKLVQNDDDVNDSDDSDEVDSDDDDSNVGTVYKRILVRPDIPPLDELPPEVQQLLQQCNVITNDPTLIAHRLRPADFTAAYVLDHVLPEAVHPTPTSFETIGHVCHLNLRAPHEPYRHVIGQIFLETLPNLRTVIHKVGQVSGPYRTYPYEIVAERQGSDNTSSYANNTSGTTAESTTNSKSTTTDNKHNPKHSSTMVSFSEAGVHLKFDVREVYWSGRLSEERRRLIDQEFQPGEWIADAFCGVGALCLQAALKKQCRITANDWNPAAIEALKHNAQRNKLQDAFLELSCADAYDFLTSLGFAPPNNDKDTSRDPAASSRQRPPHLPHHVVLNFPLDAASFLGALRWWPVGGVGGMRRRKQRRAQNDAPTVVPRVHVYIFAKESSSAPENGLESSSSFEENAVNEIASHLLPALPGEGSGSQTTTSRWEELDQNFGCNIKVHNVRNVAPGKVVMCVSFSATERLLRFMQGDF